MAPIPLDLARPISTQPTTWRFSVIRLYSNAENWLSLITDISGWHYYLSRRHTFNVDTDQYDISNAWKSKNKNCGINKDFNLEL